MSGVRGHLTALIVALSLASGALAPEATAQETLSMSVASDILFPVSNFADLYNNGFGGNIQWRFSLGSAFQLGLTTGFFSWSVKEGRNLADLKGVPARVLAKLNFASPMYLIAEGGGFISWYKGETNAATKEFNFAVGFGVEPHLSKDGDIRFDTSLRYETVARNTVPINNIVLRVGVTFTLIQ